MDSTTFITNAFQSLTERSGKKGAAARFVQSQDGATIEEQFVNAIIATYSEQESGGESTHHMLTLLGLFQDLLDKCSWNARRLTRALQREAEVGDINHIYGVDTVESTSVDVGVSCELEHIEEVISNDYAHLTIEWSRLSQVVAPDRDDAQLYMFAPSQYDEASEQWVQTHKCEDFGSALAAMDLEADRLAEKSRQEAKQKLLALRELQAAA
jgi:hypothetical protein